MFGVDTQTGNDASRSWWPSGKRWTGLVNKRRAVTVVYLDFGKAVSGAYHSILADKLVKWGLVKWAERWTENQLPYWA